MKNSQLFDSTGTVIACISNLGNVMVTIPSPIVCSGLDVQVLTKKMQLLTLTSMATTRSEIDFSLVERELDIEPASVDSTVIEGTASAFECIILYSLYVIAFTCSYSCLFEIDDSQS